MDRYVRLGECSSDLNMFFLICQKNMSVPSYSCRPTGVQSTVPREALTTNKSGQSLDWQ